MYRGTLPSIVTQDIVDSYLTCHDQVIASHTLTEYFHINDGLLSTILISAHQIDLCNLFRTLIKNNSRYIEQEESFLFRDTLISWPYLLPRSFDFITLNKVWAYYCTDLFCLYVRLFSYSPFVHRPKYTIINIFKVPFILQPDCLSFYEQSFFQLYGENSPTSPEIVCTFQEFYLNLMQRF
ncbi:unnamed protein product [Rotaria magnacalcarata]|uniref:Uncharacterized protein n=1 Tax=Rotaria magnacalcarata TaxID=392030 RepID=A0A820GEQ8_9BILA|nr:unnamed protein product [Rotaria magnacalcarata]CAF4278380.1 unnamed protein product [Rotaria magnacalcarata]